MITPRSNRIARAALRALLHIQFTRYFRGVYLLKVWPTLEPNCGVIITPNHTSWWDGFFPFIINEKILQRELVTVVNEPELRRLSALRYVGCCSIHPAHPRPSFKFLSEFLETAPAPLISFFPQGKILPNDPHAFILKEGLRLVRCKRPTYIVPLHIRLEPGRWPKPAVFLMPGSPIALNEYQRTPTILPQAFRALHQDTLDWLVQHMQRAQEIVLSAPSQEVLEISRGSNRSAEHVTAPVSVLSGAAWDCSW